jgi:alpha-glucosidase
LTMAQASYQGLEQLRPTERSFVLTRSGYAGIQRWSAVWTGTINPVGTPGNVATDAL